jgi:hypothetical protein
MYSEVVSSGSDEQQKQHHDQVPRCVSLAAVRESKIYTINGSYVRLWWSFHFQ